MTGGGIYYAIKSAKLAARIIYQALKENCLDLSLYTQQINAQITRDFKYAHLLTRLLYRLPWLSFHFVVRNPLVLWGIADVLNGDSTFEQLFFQILKNSPRVPLTALRQCKTDDKSPPSQLRRRGL